MPGRIALLLAAALMLSACDTGPYLGLGFGPGGGFGITFSQR